ncbi:MAG: cytoplasmic protein [Bacillales bacterium]|nr:cytoplasmic protein [Bacillales bacterium]
MIYIAFFRGINVGKNRIKMDDLRSMFESLGFTNVRTYIQSGNVLFESDLSLKEIIENLEKKYTMTFGFSSTLVLRTKDELENILNNLPFTKDKIEEAKATCISECLYVTILKETPSNEAVVNWIKFKTDIEEFQLNGRELYILVRTTIRDSKLSLHAHKLDKSATSRNWNTMMKLFELAKEIG